MDTPRLVLRRRSLLEGLNKFKGLGEVYYPVKSNAHPVLLRELSQQSIKFEIDSSKHLEVLLELGVLPADVQFSLPIRSVDTTKHALDKGVTRFVVDSLEELERLLTLGASVPLELILRLEIKQALDLHDTEYNKWGASREIAESIVSRLRDNVQLAALSFYLPREVYSSVHLFAMIDHASSVSQGRVDCLDIGGGLDDFDRDFTSADLHSYTRSRGFSSLLVEPGRRLLDPCMSMLATVVDVVSRGPQVWAYLDLGIYNGLLDRKLIRRDFQIAERKPRVSGSRLFHVSGPTSDTLDYLGEYWLSSDLTPGDQVEIPHSGAYSFALMTQFAGPPTMSMEVIDC